MRRKCDAISSDYHVSASWPFGRILRLPSSRPAYAALPYAEKLAVWRELRACLGQG
jgi:hypothetical protein